PVRAHGAEGVGGELRRAHVASDRGDEAIFVGEREGDDAAARVTGDGEDGAEAAGGAPRFEFAPESLLVLRGIAEVWVGASDAGVNLGGEGAESAVAEDLGRFEDLAGRGVGARGGDEERGEVGGGRGVGPGDGVTEG